MKRLLLPGLTALLFWLGPAACSLTRGTRLPPLPPEATQALAEARELVRARPVGWRVRAEDAARRAAAAAPDWLAPERVLDDLEREVWLGHQALEVRRAALEPEASPAELYLAGRLEGPAGLAHIERAARQDPTLAWAQHGLAWYRFLGGAPRAALREGRRALELARGSYELGQFAGAQARYLLELERVDEAVELLADTLGDARLLEPEHTEVAVALAQAELTSERPLVIERGFWRALGLLEQARLTTDEYERLGEELLARRARVDHPDPSSAILAALEAGDGDGRARLRARVLMERGAHALAAVLWERAGGASVPGRFARARALERGAAEPALASWCQALPRCVKGADELPLEPSLRALVLAARASAGPSGARSFGQALLAAGWFAEAESFAQSMSDSDPDAALALSARAAAGQALLAGVHGLLERVDDEREALVPVSAGPPSEPLEIEDLDGLLAALQPFFERYHGAPLATALVASPRLTVGGFAEVVHPGPSFSALDEREGRGRQGEPVPGLAAELARLGRFGIFGQAPGGGGPDGTILRRIGGEWRSGAHLGVPYAGYVAWCEGADIPSRPGRAGSAVSGAALHEGYWIDVEGVRRDWERLRALEREFDATDPALLELALAGRGPRLAHGAGPDERARWSAPLGEGQRVLLAVLRERPAEPGQARVSLDEWLALTALHEEGHLTDHTRFLPLARKWPKALGFALRHGFTARSVGRALEYRAQLVALCEAPEPRLVLADCLSSAENEGGALPHGEAYRELVEGLLLHAARALESFPALSPEHPVLYQLHRLSGEDVRRLALAQARTEGLIEE